MADIPSRDTRDLVLAPNEFAHVQDSTKGEISTYVGPCSVTLSGNDLPMLFNANSKMFDRTEMYGIKQKFITAPAGWYVELLNPAGKHPSIGKCSTPEDMSIGKKVVIPGPCSFALWPGQMASVIRGHRLRSNEYVVIEVYDAEAAGENWTKATVQQANVSEKTIPAGADAKPGEEEKKGEDLESSSTVKPESAIEHARLLGSVPKDLANGKRYVIKGTEYAFYIPPSGVKVVQEAAGEFIRSAVTLEKLEYAILLDENGEKEYAYGPKVVFPQPSQTFVIAEGKNKFRAIELDSRKGVFVKVIEAYEEGEKKYTEGEELFITGDGLIYFPRKEHSIIRYGTEEMHFAIAIPKGEARYVLDRVSGEVKTVKGPKMYLPDPRKEVVTRRILTERETKLFYPGNVEALSVNLELAKKYAGASPQAVAETISKDLERDYLMSAGTMKRGGAVYEKFGGDAFERNKSFTEPRTVILNTKYQGAVLVNVWTGYAIKVVDKTGRGRVVVGPTAILLEYDESLEPMQLSTGTPKSSERLMETGYLKVSGNKVSDKVNAITADLVGVDIRLSYRVNFEGQDNDKWFGVENYVKFLCDHARSVLMSVVKKTKIADLHANLTEIVRDTILGKKPGEEKGERIGMRFEENAMRIYDVEVLDLQIGDDNIQSLLEDAQQTSIKMSLTLAKREIEVGAEKRKQDLNCEELRAKRTTEKETHAADIERSTEANEIIVAKNAQQRAEALAVQKHASDLASEKVMANEDLEKKKLDKKQERAELEQQIADEAADAKISLAKKQADADKELTKAQKETAATRREITSADNKLDQEKEESLLSIAIKANEDRAKTAKIIAEAFGPDLVQAINNLGNHELLKTLSKEFGDLSILEGKGIMATASRFLDILPKDMVPTLVGMLGKKSKAAEKIAGDDA